MGWLRVGMLMPWCGDAVTRCNCCTRREGATMGRIAEAEGAIAAAERANASLRRVTVLALVNIVLSAILLGVVIALNLATWR